MPAVCCFAFDQILKIQFGTLKQNAFKLNSQKAYFFKRHSRNLIFSHLFQSDLLTSKQKLNIGSSAEDTAMSIHRRLWDNIRPEYKEPHGLSCCPEVLELHWRRGWGPIAQSLLWPLFHPEPSQLNGAGCVRFHLNIKNKFTLRKV